MEYIKETVRYRLARLRNVAKDPINLSLHSSWGLNDSIFVWCYSCFVKNIYWFVVGFPYFLDNEIDQKISLTLILFPPFPVCRFIVLPTKLNGTKNK